MRRLHLTPAAEPIIAELFTLARQLEDDILAVLTPAERRQLKDMLDRLARRLAGRESPNEAGGEGSAA